MTTAKMYHIIDDLAISEAIYSIVRRSEEAVNSLMNTLKVWSARAADRRQLAQMNDRLLADIGLSRSDIYVEVNKHFWQK
ncbi:MAG: DUF1127 domain-containing protein [Gammaproteobacteria bacterium]|nr:DUF1127 domain-containing protein [Gammaproteobacteria bacterium]